MHNLPLARETYEAAYSKIEDLNFWYTSLGREWYGLAASIVSKLIVLVLELHDHEAVHRWADLSIEKQFPAWLDAYSGYYKTDVADYRDEIGYIAHYGKAVTFQKQGKTTAAILEFERALECDGGCHATYYQLGSLKVKQAEIEEDRLQHMTDEEREMEKSIAKGWVEIDWDSSREDR